MNRWLILLLSITPLVGMPQQVDTSSLKALYDRCLNFDENKADSVDIYGTFIAAEAKRLHYSRGDVLSTRLKGLAEDLKGNYDKAIIYYLQSLEAARKLHALNYQGAALSDLAYIYVNTKQPSKARDMYLESAKLAAATGNISSLVTSYINLGGIYNQLKLPDSALVYLNEGLKIAGPYKRSMDLTSLYNNIGNVYFQKKEYDKALPYFQKNLQQHLLDSNRSSFWTDNLNIADVLLEKNKFDSANFYAQRSLSLALQLSARNKLADSYSLLSRLFFKKGDFRKAYDYQQQWYKIDTSLVNEGTNKNISDLQERFHATHREQENKMLQVEIEKVNLRNRTVTYLALSVIMIAVLVAISLLQKRRANNRLKDQNELIKRQNEKLAELNFEKNSLISIVSHDLGSPFASIKMWSNVLKTGTENLTDDQLKAVDRIHQSSAKGESLIRTILDVEKAETNRHKMYLESFDLKPFVKNIVEDFMPAANGKDIQIHFEAPDPPVYLVSDKHLVGRICENLISNSIKYTPRGKNIRISLSEERDTISIRVEDEGVGIQKEELSQLFSRYSEISSLPTNGEASTGLGLSIVKRIVQELNGSIFCESEPGKGSFFTIMLKK